MTLIAIAQRPYDSDDMDIVCLVLVRSGLYVLHVSQRES